MSDTERIIGALTEFKEDAKCRFDKIEKDIEDLKGFKWRVIGGAMLVSFVFTALIQLGSIYARIDKPGTAESIGRSQIADKELHPARRSDKP